MLYIFCLFLFMSKCIEFLLKKDYNDYVVSLRNNLIYEV